MKMLLAVLSLALVSTLASPANATCREDCYASCCDKNGTCKEAGQTKCLSDCLTACKGDNVPPPSPPAPVKNPKK